MTSFASQGHNEVDIVQTVIDQTKRRKGKGTLKRPYQPIGGENIYWGLYSAIVNAVLASKPVYFGFSRSIYKVEPRVVASLTKFTKAVWFSSTHKDMSPKYSRFCKQLLKSPISPKLALNKHIVIVTLV